MLTELERDLLLVVESLPGFEGVWRLPAAADGYELAVAVRDTREWRVRIEAMAKIHPHEHARILVFDPGVGTPPVVARSPRLELDTVSREAARASVAARQPFGIEGGAQPSSRWTGPQTRRSVLVVEPEFQLWTQLRDHLRGEVSVERLPRAFDAIPRWWWSNRRDAPDVVVVDSKARDALRQLPSLARQPRYVGRVFVADDGEHRFPFLTRVSAPLRDDELAAIATAVEREPVVEVVGREADVPCVVVVDTERGFGRTVRAALDDADVVRVDEAWEALDVVRERRVDCVLLAVARQGDAERFLRFHALFVGANPKLRGRVLFVTDESTKRRLDEERPAVARRFLARTVDDRPLRAALAALVAGQFA